MTRRAASAPRATIHLPGGVRLLLTVGTMAHYARLARFHYLAGPPAVPDRVRVAIDLDSGELAAVLVTAMPTLNGLWRASAWPGRYTGRDKTALARRLNRELRCIARVVTDPRYRGLGVARAIVRDYLDHPRTHATEAIAAMGSACRFFEAAGMRAYPMPTHRADARLLDALHERTHQAADLFDPRRAQRITRDALLSRELRTWAHARTTTRPLADLPTDRLVREAAHRLSCRPVAYAHTPSLDRERGKEPTTCRPRKDANQPRNHDPPDPKPRPRPASPPMSGICPTR